MNVSPLFSYRASGLNAVSCGHVVSQRGGFVFDKDEEYYFVPGAMGGQEHLHKVPLDVNIISKSYCELFDDFSHLTGRPTSAFAKV